jgi:hypothetical protein
MAEKIIIVILIAILFLQLYRVRYSKVLTLYYLYVISYPLFVAYSIFNSIGYAVYKEYQNPDIDTKNLSMFLISSIITFFLTRRVIISEEFFMSDYLLIRESKIVFLFLFLILNAITWFAFGGEDIIDSGGYNSVMQEDTEKKVGIDMKEYFILFYLLGYVFSENQLLRYLLFMMGGIFSLKCLLLGGRIELLQLILMNFILLGEKKVSYKQLIILFILAGYFMLVFGRFRGDPLYYLNDPIMAFNVFNRGGESSDIIVSNQGDVFYATNRMIGLVDDGIWGLPIRFNSFLANISRIILPKFMLPEYVELSIYMKNSYPTGGGGLIIGYLYVWFGFFGGIVFGWVHGVLINNYLSKTVNNFKNIYLIMVFSTYPRWFAYFPTNLFKMCLFPVLFYFIFTISKSIDSFKKPILS